MSARATPLSTLSPAWLAHELRTPLGGLSAALEVLALENPALQDSASEAYEIVRRQARRLAAMVEAIDAYGISTVTPVPLAIDGVLSRVLDRTRTELKLPPQVLPPTRLVARADAHALQLLLSLLLRYGLPRHPGARPCLEGDGKTVTVVFGAASGDAPDPDRTPLALLGAQHISTAMGAPLHVRTGAGGFGFTLQLQQNDAATSLSYALQTEYPPRS